MEKKILSKREFANSVQTTIQLHNKDRSKIKDYKELVKTSDWTFSTPYKGTTRYLSEHAKIIEDLSGLHI